MERNSDVDAAITFPQDEWRDNLIRDSSELHNMKDIKGGVGCNEWKLNINWLTFPSGRAIAQQLGRLWEFSRGRAALNTRKCLFTVTTDITPRSLQSFVTLAVVFRSPASPCCLSLSLPPLSSASVFVEDDSDSSDAQPATRDNPATRFAWLDCH